MPAVDIDRDAAHEAAQRELGKPIYPKASLSDRLDHWFEELLYRIAAEGSAVPGGWLTISVLLILLAIAVVVAVRIARRTMRTDRSSRYSLFDPHDLTAAQHRSSAERFAAEGNWSAAIRHRLRAVARQLEEIGALDAVPGRTATELARDAAPAVPNLTAEFARAADAFNDVTYGQRPGSEPAYRMIADLDDHLRFHMAAVIPSTAGPTPPQTWARVR